jgi:hypothetical protein
VVVALAIRDERIARRQRVCPVCGSRALIEDKRGRRSGSRMCPDGTRIGFRARAYRCLCGETVIELRGRAPMTRSEFEDWIVERGGIRRDVPPTPLGPSGPP